MRSPVTRPSSTPRTAGSGGYSFSRPSWRTGRLLCTIVDISERKQTEREITRRNKELAIINQIGTAISTATTLEELQKVALEKTLGFMDFDVGAIYLVQNGVKAAELVHQQGIPEAMLPAIREYRRHPPLQPGFVEGVPLFYKDVVAGGIDGKASCHLPRDHTPRDQCRGRRVNVPREHGALLLLRGRRGDSRTYRQGGGKRHRKSASPETVRRRSTKRTSILTS